MDSGGTCVPPVCAVDGSASRSRWARASAPRTALGTRPVLIDCNRCCNRDSPIGTSVADGRNRTADSAAHAPNSGKPAASLSRSSS